MIAAQRAHGDQAAESGEQKAAPAAAPQAGALWGPLALNVLPISDPLEQQADRTARCAASGGHCECAACRSKRHRIYRSADDTGAPMSAGAAALVHQTIAEPGDALDASTRGFFEPRFGRDFSNVRVHTGARADTSARAVRARAYTSGSHIVFASDRFSPASTGGRQLLAHELTHVVQQDAAPAGPPLTTGRPGDRFERQAAAVSGRVIAGGAPPAVSAAPAPVVQGDWLDDIAEGAGTLVAPLVAPVAGVAAEAVELAGDCGTAAVQLGGAALGLSGAGIAQFLPQGVVPEDPPGQLRAIAFALRSRCIRVVVTPLLPSAFVTLLPATAAFLGFVAEVIENPEIVLGPIREAIGKLVEQVPGRVREIVKALESYGGRFAMHIAGIWRHLEPGLEHLAAHWWDMLVEAGTDLLFPWRRSGGDLSQIWTLIQSAWHNLTAGNISTFVDDLLGVWRVANVLAGRWFGWFTLASALVGGVIGGIAGAEVGVLPGVIAGAGAGLEFALGVGEVLLISTVAAEEISIDKAALDLAFREQTPDENEADYKQIAQSSLVLGIIGVLFLLGELAAWLGRKAASVVGRGLRTLGTALLGEEGVAALQAALRRISAEVQEVRARWDAEGRTTLLSGGVTRATYEGPASDLHPERYAEILAELDRAGVKPNWRTSGDPWNGAYGPGKPGEPGSMNLHEEVDLSTLEHEFQHFLDDQARGHPGLRYYLENRAEMWAMEEAAYLREIEVAQSSQSLTSEQKAALIEELEDAMEIERARLLGEEPPAGGGEGGAGGTGEGSGGSTPPPEGGPPEGGTPPPERPSGSSAEEDLGEFLGEETGEEGRSLTDTEGHGPEQRQALLEETTEEGVARGGMIEQHHSAFVYVLRAIRSRLLRRPPASVTGAGGEGFRQVVDEIFPQERVAIEPLRHDDIHAALNDVLDDMLEPPQVDTTGMTPAEAARARARAQVERSGSRVVERQGARGMMRRLETMSDVDLLNLLEQAYERVYDEYPGLISEEMMQEIRAAFDVVRREVQ
jgi:hypothetical protein